MFHRAAELRSRFSDLLRVREDVPGAEVSTFALGGAIACLVEPRSITAVQELLLYLKEHDVPWRVLGAGSNVLIPDEGIKEVVIHLGRDFTKAQVLAGGQNLHVVLNSPESSLLVPSAEAASATLFVQAGASLMGVSRRLSQQGWSGFEFAAGIPATLGGAIRMNAGAHGRDISQRISEICCISSSGERKCLLCEDLQFGYRSISLPEQALIVAALFELQRGEPAAVSKKRSECLAYRRATQPLHLPSAGSVFRNPSQRSTSISEEEVHSKCLDSEDPSNMAAAQLLERAGVKGLRVGGVSFSPMHANWIVKIDNSAKSSDVISLIQQAQDRVQQMFGLQLRPELIIW